MRDSHEADAAIIGLGVIGGSVALRLRQRGTDLRAFTTSESDAADAKSAGIFVAGSLEEAVNGVGLVLIAVPLDRICIVAEQVIGAADERATILHAASLQRTEALGVLPETAARIVGTHPLAGSHRSGFPGARADLFRGAAVYMEERATAQQREDAEFFWSLAGAHRVVYLSANEHDEAMSWVSHLPQLASTALASTYASRAPNESELPSLGPGGRDTTRLAMSALEMWRPILDGAPQATLAALGAFEDGVRRLRSAIENRDWPAVEQMWHAAQQWRSGMERGTVE